MKTLIVTDNVRQAQFIQKGFRYENLPADIWNVAFQDVIPEELPFYDGCFFLFHELSYFRRYGELCRGKMKQAPFVFMSQKQDPSLQTFAKELNVAYLAVRPFSFRSLAAEMRIAIFQTKESVDEPRLVLRDLELDVVGHRFLCKGKEINLRNKEFSLLQFLMAHPDTVLSRSELLENVWDRNASILTNTVDVHISQLRKKISQFTDDQYIHTVPCRGYIFA